MLKVNDLTVAYGSRTILDHVSFTVAEGEWLMLVGPNGAGKTTIVKAISQGAPYTGSVLLDGEDLRTCRADKRARGIGVLSQDHTVGYSFTVEEVVRLGRYAHSNGLFSAPPAQDNDAVRAAMEATGMLPMAGQSVLTLSGGELQRTFLAQTFAQDPKLLVLDEPTNHLDLVYQKQVFELVAEWLKQPGRAVISVVHDLSLARRYGTHALLLQGGRIVAEGAVDGVFTRERLREVYSIDVYGWMRDMLGQWQE